MSKLINIFIVVLGVISICCGENSGDEYALWNSFTHKNGVFTFYYLSPPWSVHGDSTDIHPVMIVDNFDHVTDGGLIAKMRLEAWYDSDLTMVDLAAQRRDYWYYKGYESETLKDCTNIYRQKGVELVSDFKDHVVREVFYNCLEGSIVLSFWTLGNGDTADINMLIDSFACEPDAKDRI